ncbi:MAG: hypothetical protein AAGA46_00625 [Cyanobacteria bacterium P01_F01_bin.13]
MIKITRIAIASLACCLALTQPAQGAAIKSSTPPIGSTTTPDLVSQSPLSIPVVGGNSPGEEIGTAVGVAALLLMLALEGNGEGIEELPLEAEAEEIPAPGLLLGLLLFGSFVLWKGRKLAC